MKFPERIQQSERQLLEIENRVGANSIEVCPVLQTLAYARHAVGDLPSAQRHYERVLAIYIQNGLHATEVVLNTVHGLGLIHRLSNNFDLARLYYKHAVDIASIIFGAGDFRTCKRYNYLAGLYFAAGDFDEAAKTIQLSRDTYATLKAGSETLFVCILAQSIIAFRAGLRKEGEMFLQEASKMAQRVKADLADRNRDSDTRSNADSNSDSVEPGLSFELLEFVMVQLRQGNIADAEALFRHVLVGETRDLWPHHPLVAKNMKRAGDLYKAFGQLEKAAAIYEASLEMYMKHLGTADVEIADLAEVFGTTCAELKRTEKARNALRLAMDMREIFLSTDQHAYLRSKQLFEALPATL